MRAAPCARPVATAAASATGTPAPVLRKGGHLPSFLEPRRAAGKALAAVIREACVHGVSTRSVDDLVKAMGAGGMSKSRAPRLCADIDVRVTAARTAASGGFAAPPLARRRLHRGARRRRSPSGLNRWRLDGSPSAGPSWRRSASTRTASARRRGVHAGHSEAEVFRTDFLRGLADRGLRGVSPVIADDRKGPARGGARVLAATHQRRRIHWMRNALAHAPARRRGAVAAMLKTILAQETKPEAVARWDAVADALRDKRPELAALMDASREDALACMASPRGHWPQIASANPLERVNKEIKRRSDVVGVRPSPLEPLAGRTSFPDDEAVIRLVGALMLETDVTPAISST